MQELCEAANAQVDAHDHVRIANFLCNGNYAISGGIPGCEAVERIAKPDFKVRPREELPHVRTGVEGNHAPSIQAAQLASSALAVMPFRIDFGQTTC